MATEALTRSDAIQRLRAAGGEIRSLVVRRLALFGSVLRDEARSGSDVDILVEFGPAEKVPADFRAQHPEVEWRAMAAMRDRLIHGYFGVDHKLVWEVVVGKIPDLRRRIAAILEALQSATAANGRASVEPGRPYNSRGAY